MALDHSILDLSVIEVLSSSKPLCSKMAERAKYSDFFDKNTKDIRYRRNIIKTIHSKMYTANVIVDGEKLKKKVL